MVSLFPHPASFRFHLAMDTLTFGYILPTTGRIRDLHPLETCAAGRTSRKRQPQRKIFVAAVLIGGLKQKNPRLYQGNKNFSIA